MYFSIRVEEVARLGDPAKLFAFKDTAWRSIFWVSLPPGVLFVIGSLAAAESPRWLFRRGQPDAARIALLRSRTEAQAEVELQEMAEMAAAEKTKTSVAGEQVKEPLLQRRYVIPFVLACVILACNQTTGINSIIGYNATILLQAGLNDVQAHWGYLILTAVSFLTTICGIMLVDRKGRKFLISLGSAGIILSLLCTGTLFRRTEKLRVDCAAAIQAAVTPEQAVAIAFNEELAARLVAAKGAAGPSPAFLGQPTTLIVIYSYGDFRAATKVVRSDDEAAKPIEITRASCVPPNKVVAFFSNPFADLNAARTAPLKIENALITPVPSTRNGWLTAACLFVFIGFFSAGPGMCVWLALSELMPTRIRSNGMSIALLVNQAISTTIAATFLPTVGKYGYSTMFFAFAGSTVVYFITAVFFLPETKGKTLEEIEEHFNGRKPGIP